MLPVLSLLILTFAVSLDGFTVGVMYGLRKIRMPLSSIAIISCCSGVIIYSSMQMGRVMLHFMSAGSARRVGAVILIGIGLWTLFQMMMQRKQAGNEDHSATDNPLVIEQKIQSVKTLFKLELKHAGLVIQILRTPSVADVDRSGVISPSEAGLLGIALSLDAFGAGLGAALIGFPPLITSAVIAFASGTFIASGLRIGYLISGIRWVGRMTILPGIVLILIGIIKLL